MASSSALVTPEVLRWARESGGFTIEEVSNRLNIRPEKLERAETGDEFLTLRQAETAARMYERPLAALFAPTPPVEESVDAQFRRLPGTPAPPWPRKLRSLVRGVNARQQAATELLDLLDVEPAWASIEIEFDDRPDDFAARLRELLGITLVEQHSWQDRSGYRPLREWIGAVEALGVFVMQDGRLDVDTMRGFASTHKTVPAIVVNTQDDPRARAFTVVHELGHLLRARAGRPTGATTERWCDAVASATLMPSASFTHDLAGQPGGLSTKIDAASLLYGVTRYAASVRAARLQLAPQDEINDVIEEIRNRGLDRRPKGSGGDPYRAKVANLGPAYIQLVFSALDSQALTYPVASGLLGTKVNHFDALRERLAQRAERT